MDTPKLIEIKKKAIFDLMSKKRKDQILKKMTYQKWNPFEEPKDPIDIRTDENKKTPSSLVQEFLKSKNTDEDHSKAYSRGLLEMVIGLVNDDDRYISMYEFSIWYNDFFKKI